MTEEPSLFDLQPHHTGYYGCWMIYDPEFNEWWPFPADLAAQYSAQGCLTRLVGEREPLDESVPCLLPPVRNPSDYPEADPEKPPFSGSDCVWHERASRYAAEAYGPQWSRMLAWLREYHTDAEIDAMMTRWRSELGEWGGGTNLAANTAERERRERAEPPPEPIPF